MVISREQEVACQWRLVDIVSVVLILQTRYLTPAGCSQAPSIVSPNWPHLFVRLHLREQQELETRLISSSSSCFFRATCSTLHVRADTARVARRTYISLQLCIEFLVSLVLYVKPCNGCCCCCCCMRQGPCFSSFLHFFPHSGMGVPPYG